MGGLTARIHKGDGTTGVMTRARSIIWTRVALIAGAVGLIELLCRMGIIKPLTIIAPSQMAFELARMLASG